MAVTASRPWAARGPRGRPGSRPSVPGGRPTARHLVKWRGTRATGAIHPRRPGDRANGGRFVEKLAEIVAVSRGDVPFEFGVLPREAEESVSGSDE